MGKYWFVLLESWPKLGRDGLTIPFIIGSQNYLPHYLDIQNIEELFIEIADNSFAEICLKYCLTMDDLVLSINYESRPRMRGFFPTINGHAQSGLFVQEIVDDLDTKIETIGSILQARYAQDIADGFYSKLDRERDHFSINDISFIKEAFTKINS